MAQYLSPGVFVEEVASSIQPIAGVGTSIAGFVGAVPDGAAMPVIPGTSPAATYVLAPAGEPRLVTSWESYKNQFGDFQAGADPDAAPDNTLAHAVYGFFNNGGSRCWVARILPLSAQEAAEPDAPALDTSAVTDALAAFEAIDEIAIVAVPGAVDAPTQAAVVSHCERLGDRFAILDGRPDATPWTPAQIKGMQGRSNYAALYFPWIAVHDPPSGDSLVVPPSGHIAGIYARVDTERGVHKAPANERIRGAVGLSSRLSRADQDGLNPAGINVIRDLNGSITVWGARTLGGDENGEWKYVNVRRLFLYLRESIDEGTQWVVFEPNTAALWSRITRNVTAFLTNVWRGGALFGSTPAEAFYVRCDASTNPPEVRDLGQVVTEVGVAVARPAEFVIFRISQWGGPGAA